MEKKRNSGSSADELKSEMTAKHLDFVRLLFPDIHGILRGKVYPCSAVNCNGETVPVFSPWSSIWGNLSDRIVDIVGANNIVVRPIANTLVERSWKQRRSNAKIGQVMCELFYRDGSEVAEDLRRIAKKQLDRLEKLNLHLYSATEFEFRLYKEKEDEKGLVPADEDLSMYAPGHLDMYEDFMIDIGRRLNQFKISTHAIHDEYAKGQMEITHRPTWGVQAADWSVIVKSIVKETAKDNEMQASFMAKDLLDDLGNSSHFNHSVWQVDDKGKLRNAFYDPDQEHHFSSFGRHWLAGLLRHAPAIVALSSPTVNCYRRMNNCIIGPMLPTWGVDNRMVSFRLKTGIKESNTYLENRLPSSASNPYLVIAASVAAGLDGVENELELVDALSPELGELPVTLSTALDSLKEDSVICDALGKRFVELFVTIKEEELQHLKDVNIETKEASEFKQEIETYRFFV